MDERTLSQMRWRGCRRALLELDLIFDRFLTEQGPSLDDAQTALVEELLVMEDHDLWYLISGQQPSTEPRFDPILDMLRACRR